MTSPSERVLGIDAAGRYGWVGIVIDDRGFVAAHVGSLRSIVDAAPRVEVIGIDIPIRHTGERVRAADTLARQFVQPMGSSVFGAPRSEVLLAATYAEANEQLDSAGMPRISKQAWALVPKMKEAAELADADGRVREIHPEVSFREMRGEPIRWSKKSWNGLLLRRRLLTEQGIDLPDELEELKGIVADDVVDAAAVAWSARRVAKERFRTFPDPPDVFEGRAVAIWC